MKSEQKLVSVIIPTYRSAKYLDMCLKSIKLQTYKNIEVLIIDSCSNDGTSDIVKKYSFKLVSKKLNRSEARNYGVKIAKGSYILFVDSDMKLNRNIISNCLKKMNKTTAGVIIPEKSIGYGFWAKCKALEKHLYLRDKNIEASRFFRRNDFLKIGGYDNSLEAGEDWDLDIEFKKIGSIARIDDLIEHYEGSHSLMKNVKNKYNCGKLIRPFIKKHKKEGVKRLLYKKSFISFESLKKEPITYMGFLFMKSLEFTAWCFGILRSFF
ncbi:MAG: glycosyltransferase [Candidatus Nanoarchaeia archaeon]|jgi:glycosyltransferase involved in cell wall biosynthesis